MAIIKNEKYNIYAGTVVKDVPSEYVKTLVTSFVDIAALNMGANIERANVDRIIEIIQEDYEFMLIAQVASAFIKGSMGYYGDGRLVPKVINGWLKETSAEYRRYQEHKEREEKTIAQLKEKPFDLQKYPAGAAICKKIDWYKAGLIDINDWDKIPLKQVAEIIGRRQMPTIEMFNIKTKK
jgi:hypothetical protein